MAAVTGPEWGEPPLGSERRRRWTWVAVAAWGLVLTGAVFWSVRNDPPTVPEQRDIGRALPALRAAVGAVVETVQDERWVLRLGESRVEDCAITPVRDGLEVSRDVTLYVAEGEGSAALRGVADGLPADYHADVVATRGGTRLSFFADAGEYVSIEADAQSTDQVLTLRVATGCRPTVPNLDLADPDAGAPPETLAAVVSELNGTGTDGATPDGTVPGGNVPGSSGPGGSAPGSGGPRATRAVVCPEGGTVSAFVADGGTADPESAPKGVPDGTEPVLVEPGGWAYRAGSESVVVTADGGRFQATVTTGCRAG